MSELPEALRQEIEELPRHYRVRHQSARGRVILTAEVRSVPVTLFLDPARYPAEPPEIELVRGWTWEAARGRKIRCLTSQERWNRTLGIIALLRELQRRFRETPPRRGRLRMRRSLVGFLFGWLRAFRERFRRRAPEPSLAEPAEPEVELSEAELLQARYDHVIREHTSRVHRYQQAVEDLMTQWRAKSSRLEELRAEIAGLEARETESLEKARDAVDGLLAAGKSKTEVKADPGYRQIQADYEATTIELGALRDRVADLESDAERHLAKIRKHEINLEGLMVELEDLKNEAAEVVTGLTLVELEKEIVDLRAGLKKSGAAEELADLRRKLRREEARVRITREATEIDEGVDDDLYLEVAEKVSAARELEASVGLEGRTRSAERARE